MLTVLIPPNFQPERTYIISVLLDEFLGLEYAVEIAEISEILIKNGDDQLLYITDTFFGQDATKWLMLDSLPIQPLSVWDIRGENICPITANNSIPVIFGTEIINGSLLQQSETTLRLGLDVFGSCFFMLTRYEEVVKPERDKFDRFPATASVAYQNNFLDRPIVNEYLEIFWSCLKLLWPKLARKQHSFKTHVSHDVDEPFLYAGTGFNRLVRRCAGDILHRGSLWTIGQTVTDWYQINQGKPQLDPYNTFDQIMDISEEHNLKSAFYFITDHTAGVIDGFYSLQDPLIRNLLRRIHARGHEIGLHTSFNTYQDSAQTKKEFAVLRQVCEEEGILQESWGGRQHYLRWQTPVTFQNWEDAGLSYDSTLSYADIIGFRCGTCYEYSVFNLQDKRHLSLKERPLLVMEVTVIRQAYMGLSTTDDSALLSMKNIKEKCKLFNGLFTILWHNTNFVNANDIGVYKEIISL
jgi:peptidoglycan/xylan/chitin deacetylase (PgdA/CDA1 family)